MAANEIVLMDPAAGEGGAANLGRPPNARRNREGLWGNEANADAMAAAAGVPVLSCCAFGWVPQDTAGQSENSTANFVERSVSADTEAWEHPEPESELVRYKETWRG